MNIEAHNKIQNIQAEDINLINEYIARIELILLDKFDQDETNDMLKFEREKIFEAIEFAEITTREFKIPTIIKQRETQFYQELRDLEENQVLPFLNFDFLARFIRNLRKSSSTISENDENDIEATGLELFIAYFLLFPIVIFSIAAGIDEDIVLIGQFFILIIFSIYINLIKSSMKNHLFILYSIAFLAMLVTASIHISDIFDVKNNEINAEAVSAFTAFWYSIILFFGLLWKIRTFDNLTNDYKPSSNKIYYLQKSIFNGILAGIVAIVIAFYAFVRAGLSLETNHVYPFVEFILLLAIFYTNAKRSKHIDTNEERKNTILISPNNTKIETRSTERIEQTDNVADTQSSSTKSQTDISPNKSASKPATPKVQSEQVIAGFTISPNLKDKIVKVTIDKKKYREFASIKLFSKKQMFILLLSISLISLGTYLYEVSTSYYNSFPNLTEGYIEIDHELAINLSFISGITLFSIYLVALFIQILIRLSRRGSKRVIYNLTLRGDLLMYEDLYKPSSGMTSSKYLFWLGELTYRDIVSIELQE